MADLLGLLASPAVQAHCVLAFSGATSAYIAIARPTLSRAAARCPAATLAEAGTSAAISTRALFAYRCLMAVYILGMGAAQLSRLGAFVFKFYTIWNWWLLGLYFALSAAASAACWRAEAAAGAAAGGAKPTAPAAAGAVQASGANDQQQSQQPKTEAQQQRLQKAEGEAVGQGGTALAPLRRSTRLSRACHALFMINAATVIIVDVVCWAVLYPMLSRGPQTPETQRIIRRLLKTFTSYNQHGLNALYIFADLFLNRHRLAFHAVGPLGLWSLLYGLWAHLWHAMTGRWLYPFLDTSKPWAPVAYLGLYCVHWAAYGIVALLYEAKLVVYDVAERRRRRRAGKEAAGRRTKEE